MLTWREANIDHQKAPAGLIWSRRLRNQPIRPIQRPRKQLLVLIMRKALSGWHPEIQSARITFRQSLAGWGLQLSDREQETEGDRSKEVRQKERMKDKEKSGIWENRAGNALPREAQSSTLRRRTKWSTKNVQTPQTDKKLLNYTWWTPPHFGVVMFSYSLSRVS